MEWGPHLCLETLSNELRINILDALKNKPFSVTELSRKIGVERSTTSHALEVLKKCSLVKMQKSGKRVFYSLNESPLLKSQINKNIFQIIDQHRESNCKICHKCEARKE